MPLRRRWRKQLRLRRLQVSRPLWFQKPDLHSCLRQGQEWQLHPHHAAVVEAEVQQGELVQCLRVEEKLEQR